MKNYSFNLKNRLKMTLAKKKLHKSLNILSSLALIIVLISSPALNVQAATSVLDEARSIIRDNYVTTVPDSVLNAPTIEDIIKGLNDPYSTYFSKQQQQDFVNAIDNKMCGIGVYIQGVPEGIKVTSVMDNSPAKQAGIMAEDIIVSANGQTLAGLDVDKASSYIKGPEGTSVNLSVKRGDSSLVFNIIRKEISVPTVSGEMVDDHTAYIDIVSFGGDTSQLFTQKLQELKAKKPDNYIIDLRNNGGGYMSTALDIAGNFIGENRAIIVEDRDGNRVGYLASDKGSIIDKPVTFLVNQYTASASEILSAAVKDYKKAYFVGTTTYGKGVAQQMFPLSDGSSLKLTVEKFYSPEGNTIQKVGVTPDFEAKDVDSLAVSELFSGKCKNDVDKRGFVKVNESGKDFEIDLNEAKDAKHWAAFKYIIDKASKDNVYIGTDKGWIKAPTDYFDNISKFLYENYKDLGGDLKDVPQNKVLTVTLNKDVNIDTIKDNAGIELINGETGERVAFDISKAGDKKINITPKENFKSGETYYLKIKDVVKPITVK